MKFEEKIKQKYLYSSGFNIFKYLYFFIQKLKNKKHIKKSYSGHAQDLIVNHFFRKKNKGIYIDVGCYHPYFANNTKLLYDRGWSGINIDFDFHTIDFFNHVRKRDENINVAVSNNESEKDLFFFHNRSTINSLSEIRKKDAKEVKKVQTRTLNSIIENSKFKNEKINFLSIDVEGHELEVLQSINLIKYCPEIIVLEFFDKNILNDLEFYNQNINEVLNCDVYKHLINNNYHFVSWYHFELFFVHDSVRK